MVRSCFAIHLFIMSIRTLRRKRSNLAQMCLNKDYRTLKKRMTVGLPTILKWKSRFLISLINKMSTKCAFGCCYLKKWLTTPVFKICCLPFLVRHFCGICYTVLSSNVILVVVIWKNDWLPQFLRYAVYGFWYVISVGYAWLYTVLSSFSFRYLWCYVFKYRETLYRIVTPLRIWLSPTVMDRIDVDFVLYVH